MIVNTANYSLMINFHSIVIESYIWTENFFKFIFCFTIEFEAYYDCLEVCLFEAVLKSSNFSFFLMVIAKAGSLTTDFIAFTKYPQKYGEEPWFDMRQHLVDLLFVNSSLTISSFLYSIN